MNIPRRLLITPGEPAGIGPDILLQLIHQPIDAELIAVADPYLLESRAKLLNIPVKLKLYNPKHPEVHEPHTLKILPVELNAPVTPGQLNLENAAYVIACLELSAEYCLENMADALITGPVQKSLLNQAGFTFPGHTEFLANFCKAPEVLMLFVVDQLKVALATTHLPLKSVPDAITKTHILKTVRLLHRELQRMFKLPAPRILVAGLNPHAGEDGLLGDEEINTLIPAMAILQEEGISVEGPKPADTLFTQELVAHNDAILAMYHDQALPAIKQLGFDRAVNVTLGLPIIRTSVDHGTALTLAGTQKANPGSLKAAIFLALKLSSMLS